MVVDVPSPATRKVDPVDERREYAVAGVGCYWLVDLDVPAVEVLTLNHANRRYDVAAIAEGDDALSVREPFPVAVRPAELLV